VSALVLTIFISLVGWFWASNMRAREHALSLSAKACESVGVQFLDQTVSISRIGVGRSPSGTMNLQRVYSFEFTRDGTERWQGRVAMQGEEVKAIHLDHPDGPVVMEPGQLV